jgi:TfoX/Sxy family transcriptional regulator of competence genes
LGEKMVALVCDGQLFVKPTEAGREFLGKVVEGCPYPGAKPCFLIDGDKWEDRAWLTRLLQISAAALPPPKKKAPTKKSK